MIVEIVDGPIDRQALLARLLKPSDGALVIFDGVVRNHAEGKSVLFLEYQAYPEMARKKMEEIARAALEKWPISDIAIVHRLGRLEIGETSVTIAVTSAHRRPAFEACQFAIDTLKRIVPIWKKEYYSDGAVWIEGQQ